MVDVTRVLRLVNSLRERVLTLRQLGPDPAAVRRDDVRLAAAKYHFVVAIETCVDIAQHMCASEGWGTPRTNADAVRTLGRHGVLTPEVAQVIGDSVGFRNILVHQYDEVDDDIVVAKFRRLDDFDAFVREVAEFVSGLSD